MSAWLACLRHCVSKCLHALTEATAIDQFEKLIAKALTLAHGGAPIPFAADIITQVTAEVFAVGKFAMR